MIPAAVLATTSLHATRALSRTLQMGSKVRLMSTDGGGKSSSSAMLQNIAMFAIAGGLGYGAVTLFNTRLVDMRLSVHIFNRSHAHLRSIHHTAMTMMQ